MERHPRRRPQTIRQTSPNQIVELILSNTGSTFHWMKRQPIRSCGSERMVRRWHGSLIMSHVLFWKDQSDMNMFHRFSAKRASKASEPTGRWRFQDGLWSESPTNEQGGGTVKDPVASGRTRSPGVLGGVAPVIKLGTIARR